MSEKRILFTTEITPPIDLALRAVQGDDESDFAYAQRLLSLAGKFSFIGSMYDQTDCDGDPSKAVVVRVESEHFNPEIIGSRDEAMCGLLCKMGELLGNQIKNNHLYA